MRGEVRSTARSGPMLVFTVALLPRPAMIISLMESMFSLLEATRSSSPFTRHSKAQTIYMNPENVTDIFSTIARLDFYQSISIHIRTLDGQSSIHKHALNHIIYTSKRTRLGPDQSPSHTTPFYLQSSRWHRA